ncbi:alpha/beta fold hydrolase [Amycolatopsis marina]|nr:alpha/beta fold hydrolase [Amycolatopsis marina]
MAELPLVLLHAFPVDARMWNPVREPLAARRRLITPDQRGLGRTPLPESEHEPSLDVAARDVLAMLDRLELDRVVLGGCSMGGYVTMAVLRAAPERVGGLVLIDTKATADTEDARNTRLTVAQRAEAEASTGWLAESMMPKLLGEQTREGRPDVVETVRDLVESQRPEGIAWAQRAMAARPDSTELLRGTDVPTLIIVGEQDTLTPPEAARALAESMPSAEFAMVGGAGHLTPLEAPERVSTEVLGWLARQRD